MSFVQKRNNLDELINLPTKAEERSMIQISFRTQDGHNQQSAPKFMVLVFMIRESASPLDLPQKSTIRVLFKAIKSNGPKTYSPPSWYNHQTLTKLYPTSFLES